jgi:hypothetical protein
MIPAEARRRPAEIAIPGIVTEREYDLICIGSPTWWLSTDVPVRSFLESAGYHLEAARTFAAGLADRLVPAAPNPDSAAAGRGRGGRAGRKATSAGRN